MTNQTPIILLVLFSLILAVSVTLFLRNDIFLNNPQEAKPDKNNITGILQLGYINLTEDEAEFYAMMFSKYAKKYNIDWRIYPAVITIESNWDPTAVSDSGAKGTMQCLETTFKAECFRYKIHYDEKKSIYNDVLLLGRGLEYLSRMVKEKGMEKGVKSYIGGPAHSATNVQCIEYWIKFKAEYSKVVTLSQDYQRMENYILNKALSN